MAQQIDDKQETVAFRAVSHGEEGRKRMTKVDADTHNIDTLKFFGALKYVNKKLRDKGAHCMDRHPVDGVGVNQPSHKSGHGGQFTWEGPREFSENELESVPAATDEGDPNYMDEKEEGRILRGERSDVAGLVVEVPKVAETGVERVDVDPQLQPQV